MTTTEDVAEVTVPLDEPVTLSLLRCGTCDRRWLAAGDLRTRGPIPCPHCAHGTAGVLGVHH